MRRSSSSSSSISSSRPEVLEGRGRASGDLRRFVPLTQPDRVGGVGLRDESGRFLGREGTALQGERAHRTGRQAREVVRIGGGQVALGGDMQPDRLGHVDIEPGREMPRAADLVLGILAALDIGAGVGEQHAADVVQQAGGDQSMRCARRLGVEAALQGVLELIDRAVSARVRPAHRVEHGSDRIHATSPDSSTIRIGPGRDARVTDGDAHRTVTIRSRAGNRARLSAVPSEDRDAEGLKMIGTTRRTFIATGAAATASTGLGFPAIGQARRPHLKIGAQGLPDSLEPINAISNTGNRITNALFDTLIHRDFFSKPDGTGSALKPGLAESWERESDRALVVTLRRGVKFHNGQEMTAEDVAFTLSATRLWGEKPIAPRGPLFSAEFDEPQILDKYKVRIRTKGPDVSLEKRLASWVAWVVPKDDYLAKGPEKFGLSPVGTGAFRFGSFKSGDRVELEANDDYFRGRSNVSGVTFFSVPEPSTRVAGLISGEYDIVTTLSADTLDVLKRYSDLEARGIAIENVHLVVYQCDHPVLKDKRVRQALNAAIDRDLLNRTLWRDLAIVPNGFQFPHYGPAYDAQRPKLKFDVALAKRLLQEAGYKGERITYRTLPNWYANALPAAQMLQQFWQAAGINAEIEVRENWAQVLGAGLMVRNWSNGIQMADPITPLTTDWGPKGSIQTSSKWAAPEEFNALIARIRATPDGDDRRRLFQRLQDIWEDEAPGTILYRPYELYAARKSIRWQPVSFEFMDLRPYNLSVA
jgi:peptide/nickel transport system substrate-binding protein